ncbi:50S ribosomal protein L3 N(5)-glutamine methyltransferase [Mangrovimicrobium sediminis]|uniref:50S ribosomal protein L3 N(5)-glutamine methyltransferase n=1 Tax=Mangrovimicrobium sediminis TaxID=2562682 RepID=A0A4Z0M737_9GAMM|nr:50S ribosomal protein L3 N(5)-glutamine methyltransferase [Haliea sp. SAOS-164]TGD75230.1 50S ribosomal protein L3 N(5)-glutamine methyltransferase [Haliea sp. SAOS-164]
MSTPDTHSRLPSTLGELLHHCHETLCGADVYYGHGTDNPWDEAVQLVLHVAGLPVDCGEEVLDLAVTPAQRDRALELLQQRIEQRQPLPYLLGRAWFAGLEFACDSRAIIPRSPLAELILDDYSPWYTGPAPRRILDLCCGGGCIGLAAAHYSQAQVDLADIDADALALAAENRQRFGLEDRVEIFTSDLFDGLPPARYDIILSNPPYVDAADLAGMPDEYRHEPALALGSGDDGLDLTRRILACAADYLADTGLLVVEVGNSWEALEAAYPQVPFTWLEFANGGHGVFALSAAQLQEYATSLRR